MIFHSSVSVKPDPEFGFKFKNSLVSYVCNEMRAVPSFDVNTLSSLFQCLDFNCQFFNLFYLTTHFNEFHIETETERNNES